MTATSEQQHGGIVRVGPFAGFYQRFEDLIGSSAHIGLYFIHSRRWRENHDAAIKISLIPADTTIEIFLPDLEEPRAHLLTLQAFRGWIADPYPGGRRL